MPFDPNAFSPEPKKPLLNSNGFDPSKFSIAPVGAEQQAASRGQPADAPIPESQVVQEMHPDLGVLERLLVKNFSNNPGATLDYLKERHPDLQFHQNKDQLLVKRPEEQQWKVLDPDNMALIGKAGFSNYLKHPSELAMDVGDQAYNLGAGALQAGAATAGATGGALAGPAGAVAGGMAAGGGTAAGLEALRQRIGQSLGMHQTINPQDVKNQGIVGAVLPAALGTGASRGALGAGYHALADEVYPKLASAASGVSSDTIKALKKYLPEMNAMGESGVMPMMQDWHSRLINGYNGLKQKVGGALEEAIGSSGEKVSLEPVKQVMREGIDQAKAKFKELPNAYNKQAVEDLETHYKDLFTQAIPDADGKITHVEFPNEVSPKTMFELQDHLKDASQAGSIKNGLTARYGNNASKADKAISDVALNAYRAANGELDRATGGLSSDLKAQYKALSKTRETLAPLFSSPEKAYSTLSNLDKQAKQPIFEAIQGLEKQGVPLLEDAKKLQAYNAFNQPQALAQSGLGSTSTSRSIPLQTLGGSLGALAGYKASHGYTGAAVGGLLGAKLGGYAGSPAMVKNSILLQRALEGAAGKVPAEPLRTGLYGQGRNAWDTLSQKAAQEELERQKQGASP